MTSQKPSPRSRRTTAAPPNKRRKVSRKIVAEPVPYVIEVRGECADYLEGLIAGDGGQLDRNPEDVVFLNRQEAGKLLDLATPIEFRVNGRAWVLRHSKNASWFLQPFL